MSADRESSEPEKNRHRKEEWLGCTTVVILHPPQRIPAPVVVDREAIQRFAYTKMCLTKQIISWLVRQRLSQVDPGSTIPDRQNSHSARRR